VQRGEVHKLERERLGKSYEHRGRTLTVGSKRSGKQGELVKKEQRAARRYSTISLSIRKIRAMG